MDMYKAIVLLVYTTLIVVICNIWNKKMTEEYYKEKQINSKDNMEEVIRRISLSDDTRVVIYDGN